MCMTKCEGIIHSRIQYQNINQSSGAYRDVYVCFIFTLSPSLSLLRRETMPLFVFFSLSLFSLSGQLALCASGRNVCVCVPVRVNVIEMTNTLPLSELYRSEMKMKFIRSPADICARISIAFRLLAFETLPLTPI